MSTNVQNLKQIGGGHRKNGQKFVDLTWNDPILDFIKIILVNKYVIKSINTLRPALHFCGANADYRCDRHSTFVATGLSPHKIVSCISANQNCSRPFLRVTVEILLLHQPLKSYKLQYKYFAVFCDFWTCLRNFPKVMPDESEAGGGGLRELYADSDSGDEFVGFDAETVRRAETTLNALIESDSNSKK